MLGNIWSTEKITRLRELSESGLSAARIAMFLGTTRNAVIAKMARENIPSRYKEKNPPRNTVRKPIKKQKNKAFSPNFQDYLNHPSFHSFNEKSKTLLELEQNDCRWPVGNKIFCGEISMDGKSYCCEHNFIAHTGSRLDENVAITEEQKIREIPEAANINYEPLTSAVMVF